MIIHDQDIFHVHSFRCGHAEQVPDEAYIQKALELGAHGIWFSDHAPFPGDPFRGRMKFCKLPEYVETLYRLKEQYAKAIDVHIGLEIEYLPTFDASGYYRELRDVYGIEFLLLGQHMAELGDGKYTFALTKENLQEVEYRYLADAIIKGISACHFDFVAHPDRIFRRKKVWDPDMDAKAQEIVLAARRHSVPLEINMHSVACKNHYWPEFWRLPNQDAETVVGLDAHTVQSVEKRHMRWKHFEVSDPE